MAWVALGIVGNIILWGYSPAKIQTVLGDLNAVWCWACFALALLEGFLTVNRLPIRRHALKYLVALLLLYSVNILNLIRDGGSLKPSSLYLIVLFALLVYLGPTKENLDGLRVVGVISMIFIYYLLLTKYNPISVNEVTGRVISGVSGPEYRNFVWPIFGLTDRYHGPFGHPNQLGIYSAFFATILASSKNLGFRLSAIGFLILTFCAASRTSIIVASLGIFLIWNNWLWNSTLRTRIRFLSYFIIIALAALILIGNSGGSGRSAKFRESFSSYPINLFYGSSTFYVENTFLNNLFSVGLVAMLIVMYLQFVPLRMLWNSNGEAARFGIPLSIQFFVASMGESVIYGSGINTGTMYLVILLSIINSVAKTSDSAGDEGIKNARR